MRNKNPLHTTRSEEHSSTNKLKIVSINTNPIISNKKRDELLTFMNKHNPEILLLNEPKLNKNHRITFRDYNVIRTDRHGAIQGGGTAILIKNKIKYEIINTPSSKFNKILEYTIIKVCTNTPNSLYIISAYATNDSRCLFTQELEHLFDTLKLEKSSNFYLIAGDLNAKHPSWGDKTFNQKGRYLKQWRERNEIKYKTKTYHSSLPNFPSKGSYLDLAMVDSRLEITNLIDNKLQTLDYESDHKAICMEINIKNIGSEPIVYEDIRQPLLFKKTNWEKFTQKAEENYNLSIPHNNNLTKEEIDEYLLEINKIIIKTIEENVPKRESTNSSDKYLNAKIKRLKKQKSFLLSRLLRDNNLTTNDKEEIKMAMDTTNEEIRVEFQKSSNKPVGKRNKKNRS